MIDSKYIENFKRTTEGYVTPQQIDAFIKGFETAQKIYEDNTRRNG